MATDRSIDLDHYFSQSAQLSIENTALDSRTEEKVLENLSVGYKVYLREMKFIFL